jgi:hypothetical protein
VINGTRAPFGPLFASKAWYDTMANSNYNALETAVRHTSGRAEFLVGYTYSKAMDNASGLGEQVYPFNYKLTKALSAFDTTNNFVGSYSIILPSEKLFGHDRLSGEWRLSGIARFATGFPVTLTESDDNSLLGTYFNASLFSPEVIGQFGTANRRFFHGPGLNNFDLALLKDLRLTESKSLEFRAEWFNSFNHAQFMTPNGNVNGATFGLVTAAYPPRIGQLALKFLF